MYGSPLSADSGPPTPELAALLEETAAARRPRTSIGTPQQRNRGSWTCQLQFYGSPKVIAAHLEHAKERFRAVDPGADVPGCRVAAVSADAGAMDRVAQGGVGIPNMAIFSIGARTALNPSPSDGHLWFSPIIPKTGEAVLEAQRVFMDAFAQSSAGRRSCRRSPRPRPGCTARSSSSWRSRFLERTSPRTSEPATCFASS